MADNPSRSSAQLSFFTSYDFFAYLIPGAMLIFCAALFEQYCISRYADLVALTQSRSVSPKLESILREIIEPRPLFSSAFVEIPLLKEPTNWLASLPVLLGIFVLLYVAGHVVSSVSSFLLDRLWVSRAIGYPYEHFLLEKDNRKDSQRPRAKMYYRGMFAWLNVFLLSLYSYLIWKAELAHISVNMSASILVVTFVLRIIGKYGKTQFERIKHRKKKKEVTNRNRLYKTVASLFFHLPLAAGRLSHYYLWVFSRPYELCTSFAVKYVKNESTPEHFSEAFRKKFKERFKEVFPGLDLVTEGSNAYWLTAMHVELTSPTLYSNIKNWHNIYGFARNLSTSFFMLFIYVVLYIYQYNLESLFRMSNYRAMLPFFLLVMAYLMFSRYLYIYFLYYSKNLFRCFVYCSVDATITPAAGDVTPKARE